MGYEIKIRDSRTDGDKLKQFVDIWADSASDIPTAKTDWVAGSIAFAIDTGVFYVLNSSGVWVSQEDFTVMGAVSTNAVSPAVSPSVLDRNKELLSGVQADVTETLEEPEVEEVEQHETVGLDES